MPSASAPFKSKSPFHSRILGLDYQSFGLDFINPPFHTTFGCLSRSPSIDFDASGHEGGPFTPSSATYTLTNTGGADISWTVTVSQSWLTIDTPGGILAAGASVLVNVTLAADALPQQAMPYGATITWTNTTNGCGNSTNLVSLTVTGDLTLTVESRTHGSIATICGYSEWTSASVPPKKYKKRTIAGDICVLDRDGNGRSPGDCSGACLNVGRRVWSGDCTISSIDCSEADGYALLQGTQVIPSCDCTAVVMVGQPAPACSVTAPGGAIFTTSAVGAGNYADVVSQTVWTRTYANNCEGPFGGCPGINCIVRKSSGTFAVTLSNESTESEAITRLLASTSYTSWSPAASIGAAKSQYESRSGFSFTYQYAQYRLSASGLSPSTLYNGSATIYRRLQGSADPWLLVTPVVVSGTTDGSGNFLDGPHDLPIVVGYEYTIWNAVLTP